MLKMRLCTLSVVAFSYVCSAALAEEKVPTVFPYLQKEPMTLFDAGMKSLRRLALDAASSLSTSLDVKVTANVTYNATVNQINIFYHVTIDDAKSLESLRQQCITTRKDAILKMFRIGLSEYATQLSVPERIRRRIGGQFAHEPSGSMQESEHLGDRLAPLTYVSVKIETTNQPTIDTTCRALVTDSLNELAKP